LAHTITLKEGFSVDGWKYEISWRDWDGKFQVVFDDDKREIWLLEDVYAEKRDGGGIVYVKGKLYTAHPEKFMKVLMDFASWLAKGLEEEGKSALKRFGKATLLFEAVLPRRGAAFKRSVLVRMMAEELERRKAELTEERERERKKKAEEQMREIERAEKAERKRRVVTPKKKIGLGRDELRRLRILFQSTCESLGIKVTRGLRVRAERVIYLLESKYKSLSREEALEKATIDLLRWIKEAVYRVPEERRARVLWELYIQAVLIGDIEKAEKALEELKRLATEVG